MLIKGSLKAKLGPFYRLKVELRTKRKRKKK